MQLEFILKSLHKAFFFHVLEVKLPKANSAHDSLKLLSTLLLSEL